MFTINIDLSEIEGLADLGDDIKKEADQAAEDLAQMVESKAKELAAQKLRTRRKMYQDGLSTVKIGDTWVVSLDAKVRWIDDGQDAYSMLEGLLNSPKAKRGKDGSRYIIVPFDHSPGRGKTASTSAQQDLVGAVKSELRKRGIPFGKTEKDAQGNDKIGKLHRFTIDDAPVKKDPGKGQRRGPVGEVMQGKKREGEERGTPFLTNVSVYQSKGKNGKTQRSILTFRIASSKHASEARWEHPGNAPVNILEEATTWAVETWEKDIAPAILDKILVELGD